MENQNALLTDVKVSTSSGVLGQLITKGEVCSLKVYLAFKDQPDQSSYAKWDMRHETQDGYISADLSEVEILSSNSLEPPLSVEEDTTPTPIHTHLRESTVLCIKDSVVAPGLVAPWHNFVSRPTTGTGSQCNLDREVQGLLWGSLNTNNKNKYLQVLPICVRGS